MMSRCYEKLSDDLKTLYNLGPNIHSMQKVKKIGKKYFKKAFLQFLTNVIYKKDCHQKDSFNFSAEPFDIVKIYFL